MSPLPPALGGRPASVSGAPTRFPVRAPGRKNDVGIGGIGGELPADANDKIQLERVSEYDKALSLQDGVQKPAGVCGGMLFAASLPPKACERVSRYWVQPSRSPHFSNGNQKM